ncbi:MAG: uL30 family ribosomal protein [Candidatus Nanohaloarchaea archaeon]
MIAAVRVRGDVDANKKASTTMENLQLTRKNRLVVYEDSDSIRGMFSRAKDYITYGELDEETVEALEEKKGEEVESGDTFNLTPPSGGFKNTKKQVGQGGSLGKRNDMDGLVQRML